MELINDIQIEVTEIRIKVQPIVLKRVICHFKRMIFLSDIKSVSEENYLVENYYTKCSGLYITDEGWIKVKEPYNELQSIHSDWWDRSVKSLELPSDKMIKD